MLSVQMILLFATAFVLSLAAVPLVMRVSALYGLYDIPDAQVVTPENAVPARRVHTAPTPRLGGIAIVGSFFLSIFIWAFKVNMLGVFIPSIAIFTLGFMDDLKPIPAKAKMLIQTMCASMAVIFGKLQVLELSITPSLTYTLPSIVGFLLAVFVIVGAINAINMIDGLDGLAGGVVLIGIALLSYIYFLQMHDVHLLLLISVPLVGALLGFLRYNTHPATIFMGDGGSNWLGFMMGVLLLLILGDFTLVEVGQAWVLERAARPPELSVPFISAILCLAVPIFDTACVILTRWKQGLSPMAPDKRHFHHSLLKLGLSHSQSVATVYFVALVTGVLGIMPIAFPSYGLWWSPYIATIGLSVVLPLGVLASEGVIRRLKTERSLLSSHPTIGPKLGGVIRHWETLNRYTIYAILSAAPLFAGVPPRSIGIAAALCIALIFLSILISGRKVDFLESFVLSIAATVLLISNNANNIWVEIHEIKYNVQYLYNATFIWLFCSAFLFFLVTLRKRYLLVSPSDFLLVTLPLLLLLVPSPYREDYRLNIIGLRSLVLFLAIRSLAKRHIQVTYRIKLVTLIALFYVTLTSLFSMRIVY